MQIFIPYPDMEETARSLDTRRLNKQIVECGQIIGAIEGARGWRNHPVVRMYKDYAMWLVWYRRVLEAVRAGEKNPISVCAGKEPPRPPFIGHEALHRAHRARLWQKDPVYYDSFRKDGDFTDCNWYIVDGQLLKYRQGQLIERESFL